LDTQGWDRVEAKTSEAQESAENGQDVPRLDLSRGATQDVRPPLKPFSTKGGIKNNPFFGVAQINPPPSKILQSKQAVATSAPQASTLKGKTMSDRFSPDRMAAFSPQVAKRIADIPNLTIARNNDDTDGKRLVIGKQIRMSGEISGCEKLLVEGSVDATLSDVKSIDVTANGTFKGNAEVESAVIAGTYEGSLKVNGHLDIGPSGVVKGNVSYKTIAVANGGKVLGSIETIES
jgi:cytoskeletal protein CcmA (bactofilin family)